MHVRESNSVPAGRSCSLTNDEQRRSICEFFYAQVSHCLNIPKQDISVLPPTQRMERLAPQHLTLVRGHRGNA
jgi:hypothetical protein